MLPTSISTDEKSYIELAQHATGVADQFNSEIERVRSESISVTTMSKLGGDTLLQAKDKMLAALAAKSAAYGFEAQSYYFKAGQTNIDDRMARQEAGNQITLFEARAKVKHLEADLLNAEAEELIATTFVQKNRVKKAAETRNSRKKWATAKDELELLAIPALIQNYEDELGNTTRKIANLNEGIASLTKRLSGASKKITKNGKSDHQKLDEQIAREQGFVEDAQEAFTKLETRIAELSEQLQSLRASVRKKTVSPQIIDYTPQAETTLVGARDLTEERAARESVGENEVQQKEKAMAADVATSLRAFEERLQGFVKAAQQPIHQHDPFTLHEAYFSAPGNNKQNKSFEDLFRGVDSDEDDLDTDLKSENGDNEIDGASDTDPNEVSDPNDGINLNSEDSANTAIASSADLDSKYEESVDATPNVHAVVTNQQKSAVLQDSNIKSPRILEGEAQVKLHGVIEFNSEYGQVAVPQPALQPQPFAALFEQIEKIPSMGRILLTKNKVQHDATNPAEIAHAIDKLSKDVNSELGSTPKNDQGMTPLHFALTEANVKGIEGRGKFELGVWALTRFVEHGDSITVKDKHGKTALPQLIDFTLNPKNRAKLQEKLLVQQQLAKQATGQEKNTLKKSVEVIAKSLSFDILCDPEGQTLLHHAAMSGDVTSAIKLLENGGSPNIKDKSGKTALHLAIKHGHFELARLMVEHYEADPTIRDGAKKNGKEGRTTGDYLQDHLATPEAPKPTPPPSFYKLKKAVEHYEQSANNVLDNIFLGKINGLLNPFTFLPTLVISAWNFVKNLKKTFWDKPRDKQAAIDEVDYVRLSAKSLAKLGGPVSFNNQKDEENSDMCSTEYFGVYESPLNQPQPEDSASHESSPRADRSDDEEESRQPSSPALVH